MSISMIGIDYNKANVDIRAMFSFTKKNATAAMERLKKIPGIQGCVILSTCNRMELWASTKADWNGTLLEELCKIKEVDPTQYGEYFVERNEEEAVDHLFHLTSGLKSMILAEDQIITQVKDALTLAREAFVTDNVLEVLFRKAVTAGKKVKTNVIFSRANQTAMDQAIEMLKERKFPLSDARCMVIGNGEMGKLAAQSLKRTGADVTVTVRQYRSGVVTIPMGCSRINYGERLNFLPGCDLVVSATASPNFTLKEENVRPVDLHERLEHRTVAKPVLKHRLGQAAALLGRQGVVLAEHGLKPAVAQQRQHVLEAVEVAVKRRAAHRRGALHVRDRDARERFFFHAGQKARANKLRRRPRAFVVLDVVHFGLQRSIFCGTIVSQKSLMYNRDDQNLRECFT